MANPGKMSSSPKEDYDPLEEEYLRCRHSLDPGTEDQEPDSPNSSVELEAETLYRYSVTPPVNLRELKRSKEKTRSFKQKEATAVIAVEKQISRLNCRDKRSTMLQNNNASESGENSDDEAMEDLSESAKKKKDSSKIYKANRNFDRDFKQNSANDLTGMDTLATPDLPIKIDSPNRFYSLHSKPVTNSPSTPLNRVLKITQNSRRQSIPHPSECPVERMEFFKTFSILINMGNTAKKEAKESRGNHYSRQPSIEEVWQTGLNDLIWLELQAWHNCRTMSEQDQHLLKAREKVGRVLQEVMEFRVQMQDDEDPEDPAHPVGPMESMGDPGADGRPVTPCHGPALFKAIEKLKKALVQVTALLNKLECVEKLYPNSKTLGKDHELYNNKTFQMRLDTLCLWMNITREIGHKLQLMAKVLYIEHRSNVMWPWLDYESPNQVLQRIRDAPETITPDIILENMEEEAEYSTEEEDLEIIERVNKDVCENQGDPSRSVGKSVRFNFSDSTLSSDDTPLTPTSLCPSDTSTPFKQTPSSGRSASTMPRLFSNTSLEDGAGDTGMYRYFVDRTLKKTGLRKLLMRLKDLFHGTLTRARQVLEMPRPPRTYADIVGTEKPPDIAVLASSPSFADLPTNFITAYLPEVTHDPSVQQLDLAAMGLPSFKPTYLFLVRIPLDVVHECLRLRLEQRPENEPSLLSVRQLIRECKEVLLGGVMVKQYYHQMVSAVTTEHEHLERTEMDLEMFEEDMKQMLELYFNYIQTWMLNLQHLPEMSKNLKNALEEEWNFTKQVCPHVRGGEANAGNSFCLMGSSLLHSISDYLETGMDECIDQLYDSTTVESNDDAARNHPQLNKSSRSMELRQAIIKTCRNFKELFHEARERASKALGFAKMLRKDLEIAADYGISVTSGVLMAKLQETSHYRVTAPQSGGHLMFVPESISDDLQQILQLLNVTCGREDTSKTAPAGHSGYLLLVKCDGCTDMPKNCPIWTGLTITVAPTAETTIALSHIEVEGILLVVIHSSQLSERRKEFERMMGAEVELVSESTSCHQAIAESLMELKVAGVELQEKLANAIAQVDEKLDLDDIPEMDENEKINIQKLYRETLHQCYNFGFEYHKEVTRLVSGEMRVKLAHSLVTFAKQWMRFVSEKCERGRGLRPRWANQGLDFLTSACEPRVLAILTDHEFIELKNSINKCILHVIGDKTTPGSPGSVLSNFRSPDLSLNRHHMLRNMSCPDTVMSRSNSRSVSPSVRSFQSEPPTPFTADTATRKSWPTMRTRSVELHEGEDGGIVMDIDKGDSPTGGTTESSAEGVVEEDEEESRGGRGRMAGIYNCIMELEQSRTNKLYAERVIGRITNLRTEVDYHINIRKVNFKWQRGIKIGEGNFGKVYTAVNIDTGELMAMKEIRFQPNDHKTIKEIADELRIFEGISHPNLVRYYGVEVHRDEMLIFMEYCSGGTISDVAKLGLAEAMIRKYTKEILSAINMLHEHGIVHRDIKGANIFLMEQGLKLGDFGSSVKLKEHTTIPGELKTMAGTAAYMAPEVITRNTEEGHGRASDIWSLGCVVIEMTTGKRPWHELENNFAIMFKVGMGATPAIPEHLSQEGKDFLLLCLVHDSKQRWSASQLQDHTFVKVYPDDEYGEGQ